MSMWPQCFCAAAMAAESVASLVTSASKATHSPPPCLTIDTVSSADARSRSTAMTFAPSCANRSAVARPLPIPSPGLCPAPMTMAVFPSRRMTSCGRIGILLAELSYGVQDLPVDLDWLGVDKDESDHTRLGAAVDPIVDRSALHEHIARIQMDDRVLELHVDLTRHDDGIID